jgi:hypothetical protein
MLALASAATAESLRQSHFDPQTAFGSGCFRRDYSNSHLASHPQQRVTSIAVGRMPDPPADDLLIVNVAVTLRGSGEVFIGSGYCEGKGARLDCGMEGDAGSFQLTAAKDGALLLSVGRYGVSFEGARDFVTLEGNSGDDREFLMPPARASACP